MTIQRSTTSRDNANNGFSTALGTTGVTLLLFTGAPPANCAATATGTTLATLTLPATPLGTSSGGVISKSGTWTGTASASGTAGYYRLLASGGACVEQGTTAQTVTAATSAATTANGNVLTFISAPAGVATGMTVSGTGIPTLTTVSAIVSVTIVISKTSTAGVASGATITFSGDMALDNTVLASGQAITITSYSQTAGDA